MGCSRTNPSFLKGLVSTPNRLESKRCRDNENPPASICLAGSYDVSMVARLPPPRYLPLWSAGSPLFWQDLASPTKDIITHSGRKDKGF
jgi:hypothetical protein